MDRALTITSIKGGVVVINSEQIESICQDNESAGTITLLSGRKWRFNGQAEDIRDAIFNKKKDDHEEFNY